MDKKTILVVDDEKNIRITLRQALEASGFDVVAAVNGEDALSKVAGAHFDLILLDMKLPGIDGIEVLRRLRSEDLHMPVVMITAYGTVESAVEAMKLGAVDYLRKPFSPEQIREIAEKVLARKAMKKEDLTTYDDFVEYAKRYINERNLSQAGEYLQEALAADSSRPEAFNLLGIILELQGDRVEAQKRYRAALALDAAYEPAQKNLDRSVKLTYSRKGLDMDSTGEAGEAEEKP
jgi:DNA-binding response OmpR family regulator